ncbi:MAG TPA: Crp/Fnr family transcriptional regulator [Flavobacteriales bacterium]|nr:Crp/Fnr family transcriptional regulator [Flavobacteriales bacterium]
MFDDPELKREFDRVAVLRSVPAGTELMRVGDTITHVPIVQSGSLRILAQDADGNERFLYHIMPGESCAMSLTCCTAKRTSSVLAIVEENAEILMIPARFMDEWMVYPEWRRFVNDNQAQRFGELLETIEVVAFRRMDEQLWDYLVKRVQATGSPVLKATHQDIANELNSPREVISRLLQQLQLRGLVTLSRGAIDVHLSGAMAPSSTGDVARRH